MEQEFEAKIVLMIKAIKEEFSQHFEACLKKSLKKSSTQLNDLFYEFDNIPLNDGMDLSELNDIEHEMKLVFGKLNSDFLEKKYGSARASAFKQAIYKRLPKLYRKMVIYFKKEEQGQA